MKKKNSYSQTFVIKKKSAALVDFFNKLREQKMTKLEELRNEKNIYFPASSTK